MKTTKGRKREEEKKTEQAQQTENSNKYAMNSTIINHHLHVNGLNTPIERQRLGPS